MPDPKDDAAVKAAAEKAEADAKVSAEKTEADAKAGGDDAAAKAAAAEAAVKAKSEADAKVEADAKAKADAEAAANAPPEKYEFKFADEKVKLDEELVGKFSPIAKELGLSNAKAQRLADLFLEHSTAAVARSSKALQDQIETWRKDFTSDPQHTQVLANAKRALSVADADTKKLFESEWIGNHPLVIRLLAKLGSALREDGLAEGTRAQGGGATDARVMFPSMKNP